MTLEKGWINRQFARIERDVQSWPEWMRREAEIRAAASEGSVCAVQAESQHKSDECGNQNRRAKKATR